MNTYEEFIFKKIKQLENDLTELITNRYSTYKMGGMEFPSYPEPLYSRLFHRLSGQIDICYMILTGHNNTYDKNAIDESKK
jgi:hypothetical protein